MNESGTTDDDDYVANFQKRMDQYYADMAAGVGLTRDEHMNFLAERAVKRMEERKRLYEAASPAERARMDDEAAKAAVAFIMDERLGGP